MNFKLYREFGALNSRPIFNAFEQGLKNLGHNIVDDDEDIAVIWSVLWAGRMAGNSSVYNACRSVGKPVLIIEVGNLFRNKTWRIGLNHINSLGFFGNNENLDHNRPKKLGIDLKTPNLNRRSEILIAAQHQQSLQWEGQPSMSNWVTETVNKIRQYSDRKIILRPHPRSRIPSVRSEIQIEIPRLVLGTYDDFDINYGYHCVVNHNSGPAVQAVINGVPVICDGSSLARNMSSTFEQIEHIQLPDRTDWFLKLCHTEWTVDEISQGIPLQRLLPEIFKQIS